MRFSYIEPRAKYLISKLSKIWVFYYFFIFCANRGVSVVYA